MAVPIFALKAAAGLPPDREYRDFSVRTEALTNAGISVGCVQTTYIFLKLFPISPAMCNLVGDDVFCVPTQRGSGTVHSCGVRSYSSCF